MNIPLIEALKNMPQYAIFLKHALSKKRKYEDNEIVALTTRVISVVQQKVSLKQKDLGSFTISCEIGKSGSTEA